jgi:hypothetical protein
MMDGQPRNNLLLYDRLKKQPHFNKTMKRKPGAWSAGRWSRIVFSAIFHKNIFPMGPQKKQWHSFFNSRSESLNVSHFYFEERAKTDR